ncbi:hypothetical protein C2W63_00738 [Bacillus velezensis]|nr:hypothetical protein C2W63_00738 [Bacillus velezensis]
MIILTARMCSGAAREGDSIRRQIRCDRFNQRRSGGSGRHDGELNRYCKNRF